MSTNTRRPVAATKSYVVANPRGIPKGRYIIRNGDQRWFEGDAFDGPVTPRLIRDGFIVEVPGG